MRSGEQPAEARELQPDGVQAQFAPVTQIRAHEYVAEQIRRHIALRFTDPGEPLPSERDLVRQFGVGRPTIQMALRLLEAEHLIETRRGRKGGTFVRETASDGEARYELMAKLVQRQSEIEELLTFRDAVEPEVAAVAAENRRAADLKRLHAALHTLDRARGEIEYMRYDTQLHLAVGAATHNRFLIADEETIRHGLNGVISLLPESDVWHARVSDEHHRLIAAIDERQPASAYAATREHAAHTREGVVAVLTALRRKNAAWRQR